MFLRILWMHDLSPGAQAAGDLLRWLAPRSDAELIIGHATGAPLSPDAEGHDVALAARDHEAQAVLAPLCAQLSAAGIPTSLRVEPGQALDLAEKLVEQEQIGLTVVGATGQRGLDRILLGSTTEKLVRQLHCSVLVARPPFQHIRRMLCAIDLNRVSEVAILQAAALARRAGATLEYITVVESTLDLAETEPAAERLARVLRDALGAEHDQAWQSEVITAETPAQGILHRANGADLVVMGTEGRRGWRRLLLGSVAERVVQSCPVSVLVAR